MAASISQQLEDLLNPLPTFADPEDDQDEETKAKVIDKFDEGDDDDLPSSRLRKHATTLLADTDKRYRGKATSRKQLQKEMEDSDEDEDDDDIEDELLDKDVDEEEDEAEDDDGDDEEEEDDDDEGDDLEEEDNLNVDDSSQMSSLVSKMKGTGLTVPKGTDLRNLTKGMDDVVESDDEEGESVEGSEEEEEEDDDDDEEEEEEDSNSGAVMTYSKDKVDEEVEKGRAVKNQLALWDLLLEERIKMQKALVTANQLPQPDTFPEFKSKGGPEYAGALKNSHKALKALQRSLLELQDLLLYQNPDTRAVSQGKTWQSDSKAEDDEEVHSGDDVDEDDDDEEKHTSQNGPPKRKLDMADYPDFMAKRFAAFQPYRDATLQKWYDKTRLTMGKTNKGFGAFERNIVTQVEQVLMDKERLLRRTQTRRSDYRVLGKPESTPDIQANSTDPEAADVPLKANAHLKDLDEEIFDDDDFYHQLLRELIERKTSSVDPNDQVAMGRQWLAIQKLRNKIKKKVDTKASKGRKVRFHIHSKLVNFMAPIDRSILSSEARSELYRSLFGSQTVH